jgi:MFS family permease
MTGAEPSSVSLLVRTRRILREYGAVVRLFSPNARLYLIGSFLIGINFSVFNLLFNLYLKELGFAEGNIGLVNSWKALGMTLVAVPAAMILSRVKLKPLLIASCVVFAVFSAGLTTFRQMELLLGCGLLAGMAFAFFRVAGGPFFMRNSTPKERTHLFSFSFAMHLLAGMIGSWAAGASVTYIGAQTGDIVLGYQYTLYVAIGLSLLAFVPFSFIVAREPSIEENRLSLSMEQFRRRGLLLEDNQREHPDRLRRRSHHRSEPLLQRPIRAAAGYHRTVFHLGVVRHAVGTLAGPVLTRRLGWYEPSCSLSWPRSRSC